MVDANYLHNYSNYKIRNLSKVILSLDFYTHCIFSQVMTVGILPFFFFSFYWFTGNCSITYLILYNFCDMTTFIV